MTFLRQVGVLFAVAGVALGAVVAACSSADTAAPRAPTEPVTDAVQITVAGLPEPLVTTKPTGSAEDDAIARAVEEFRGANAIPHDDDSEAFTPFERFVTAYPHSGWTAAALTNLGLAY